MHHITRHTIAGLGFFSLLSMGCSHSEPSSTTPDPIEEPMYEHVAAVDPEPVPEPVPEPPPPMAPGMYFADLEEVTPEPYPAFTAAIDACRNPAEGECVIKRTAGYDTRRNHWAVFDVDPGELAPGHVWLGTATASEQRATFEGAVERPRVAAIRRGLGTFRTVTPGQNLVNRAAEAPYSIMAYNALVTLGGELEGWAMWIEASGPEGNGGYTLHLLRADQTDARVLAVSANDAHCHDGDAPEYGAAADGVGGGATEEEARMAPVEPPPPALGCSPIGIDGVLLSPDRSSILVLGTRAMNGHGGAPAMHWVVPTPADLFPAAAAETAAEPAAAAAPAAE